MYSSTFYVKWSSLTQWVYWDFSLLLIRLITNWEWQETNEKSSIYVNKKKAKL